MRYNNIKIVAALFPDNEGYQYRMAKTGNNYYVIMSRKNSLITSKFNSEKVAKRYILNKVKAICDSMVKIGKWTPANAKLIYEMKELDINQFSYDTST